MNDHQLKNCLNLIKEKMSWADPVQATDSDYRRLSILIQRKTGVNISTHTLKRLFGKIAYKDEYQPQEATKNALARFLDFEDWSAYLLHQSGTSKKMTESPNQKKKKQLIVFLSCTIVFLTIFIISLLYFPSNANYSILAVNPEGYPPHTVSFNYDVSGFSSNNLFLDFNYVNPHIGYQKKLLLKDRHTVNHCFQVPGYYNVRLLDGKKELSKVQVLVKSNDWLAYFKNDENRTSTEGRSMGNISNYRYWLDNFLIDSIADGALYISPEIITKSGFNSKSIYYLEYRYFNKFNINADNMLVEANFKNSLETGGFSCFDVMFSFICENGDIRLMLVEKGCSQWSLVKLNEIEKFGEYENLSDFTLDTRNWNKLELRVINKNATIKINDKIIYKDIYSTPLNKIVGVACSFKGSGMIDYIKIRDLKSKSNYKNEF